MATHLTIRAARAQLIQRAATGEQVVDTVDDIRRLPQFAGWSPAILDQAIADARDMGYLADLREGTEVPS